MSDFNFEEEDFTTQFDGNTIKRIAQQARPYWKWVVGFLLLIGVVSFQDALFTYLSKLIIDEGIVPGNTARLTQLITIYTSMILIAGQRGVRFYLPGRSLG